MSLLSLKRYQSFHFVPNPKDMYKPNFVFSSDIPEKVQQLRLNHPVAFNINIELNTLMNRNRNLKPSHLVRDNLIFLAKGDKKSVNALQGIIFQYPPYFTAILDTEVFIVTLTLTVDQFIDHTLTFVQDENYHILHSCDSSLLLYINRYIIKSYEDIAESSLNDISGTETTIEVLEYEIEHLYDSDEYDRTTESIDLMFLKDDDTMTLVGKLIKKSKKINDDDFITNLANLRHNDGHELDTLDLGVDSDESDFENITASKPPIITNNAPFPVVKLKPSRQQLNPPIEIINPVSRKPSKNLQIPKKPIPSSSFMIAETEDFDYSGPAFIKGDKMFKYIKVGKVQKFVNLFEERVNEESADNVASRSVSPIR